jgi:hypothetical protein
VPRDNWKTPLLYKHEDHRFSSGLLPVGMTVYYYCSDLTMTGVIAAESAATSKSTHNSSVSSFATPSKMINTVPIETKSQIGILVASIFSILIVLLFVGLRLFAKHIGSRLDCSDYCIVAALVGEPETHTHHIWLRFRCLTLDCIHLAYCSFFMAVLASTPLRYMHGLVPTPRHSSSK